MGFTRTPEMLEHICQSYLTDINRLQARMKEIEKLAKAIRENVKEGWLFSPNEGTEEVFNDIDRQAERIELIAQGKAD